MSTAPPTSAARAATFIIPIPRRRGVSPGSKPLPSSFTVSTSGRRWCRARRRRSRPGHAAPRSTAPPARRARWSAVRPDRRAGFRRQRAGGELDPGAGLKTERFTLPPQKGDEPRVPDRRPLQLIEHHLHLRHRLARRAAHLADGVERALRIAAEPRLRGRARGLDHEQLLLHRVVKIARQPRALLLSRRLTDLLFVLRPQPGDGGLVADDEPARTPLGVRRQRQQRRREIRAGAGDRQVQKDETGNQGKPGEPHRYRGHPLGDCLNEQHRAHHDVRMRKAHEGAPAADRIVDVGQCRRACPQRDDDRSAQPRPDNPRRNGRAIGQDQRPHVADDPERQRGGGVDAKHQAAIDGFWSGRHAGSVEPHDGDRIT